MNEGITGEMLAKLQSLTQLSRLGVLTRENEAALEALNRAWLADVDAIMYPPEQPQQQQQKASAAKAKK